MVLPHATPLTLQACLDVDIVQAFRWILSSSELSSCATWCVAAHVPPAAKSWRGLMGS